MNMKKTIAAIAAGAVAVSAMATTVSALSDTSFAYSLVEKKEIQTNAGTNTATFEFTVTGAKADTTMLEFTAPAKYIQDATGAWVPSTTEFQYTVKNVTVKVTDDTQAEQNKIYTYSTDKGALNYNAKLTTTDGVTTLEFLNELTSYAGTVTLTVTVDTETTNGDIKTINDGALPTVAITGTGAATPVVLKAFSAGSETKKIFEHPFKTSIKNNTNIMWYLNNAKVIDKDNSYVNVEAVLNDAIENYETVTFTFNTAAKNIAWIINGDYNNIYGKSGDFSWATMAKDGFCGSYEDAVKAANGNADALTAIYTTEWWGDSSYTSFTQHLYPTYYSPENTTWTGFDWTGYNLFQGALIVNENMTMSLAETDYFDWTATSLSFDWDAIMDGAMTNNNYATYLHNMKLATSNTWYWDNMTVVLTAGATDDATSDAATEGNEEVLDEEPVEDEVIEEEVVEEEVEEEVEEPEVEVEVENPTTGNASVALAVIPVALAAAAVVAKKRS